MCLCVHESTDGSQDPLNNKLIKIISPVRNGLVGRSVSIFFSQTEFNDVDLKKREMEGLINTDIGGEIFNHHKDGSFDGEPGLHALPSP